MIELITNRLSNLRKFNIAQYMLIIFLLPSLIALPANKIIEYKNLKSTSTKQVKNKSFKVNMLDDQDLSSNFRQFSGSGSSKRKIYLATYGDLICSRNPHSYEAKFLFQLGKSFQYSSVKSLIHAIYSGTSPPTQTLFV